MLLHGMLDCNKNYQVPVKGSPQVSLSVRELLPPAVKRLPLYSVERLRCIGTLLIATDEMVEVPLLAARVTLVCHCALDEKVKTVRNWPLCPTSDEGQLTVMACEVACGVGEPSV